MLNNFKVIVAACVAALFASGASAQPKGWTVGIEKEHYPGYYSTYWGDIQDWQLWSIDSNDGRTCSAVKTPADVKKPAPVWRGTFADDAPHLWFYPVSKRVVSLIVMKGSPSTAEYRQVGEKFFKTYNTSDADWAEHDGHVVEFHLSGLDNSDRTAGPFDTTFKIDLSGATAAKAWVDECPKEPEKAQP